MGGFFYFDEFNEKNGDEGNPLLFISHFPFTSPILTDVHFNNSYVTLEDGGPNVEGRRKRPEEDVVSCV